MLVHILTDALSLIFFCLSTFIFILFFWFFYHSIFHPLYVSARLQFSLLKFLLNFLYYCVHLKCLGIYQHLEWEMRIFKANLFQFNYVQTQKFLLYSYKVWIGGWLWTSCWFELWRIDVQVSTTLISMILVLFL